MNLWSYQQRRGLRGRRCPPCHWRRLPQGSPEKKKNDYVTHADRESEEGCVAHLERFPGTLFSGRRKERGGSGSPTYLISILGLDFHCRGVSLLVRLGRGREKGNPGWGRGTRFARTLSRRTGSGDFRDGRGLRSRPRSWMSLLQGFLPIEGPDRSYLALHDVFLLRRSGGPIGCARSRQLASGVFDGFFEFRLSVWDIAAGVLLIEEAGGRVTDYGGGSRHWERGNVVAGTKGVVDGIIEVAARHFSEEEI